MLLTSTCFRCRGGGLLFLLLLSFAAAAQAPAWQTAVATSGASTFVESSAADANGNLYLVGRFFGTAIFGSTSLTSVGQGNDAFVAKWNGSTGGFSWAVRMGSAENDFARAVAVLGNTVYVAGEYLGATADFGPLTLTNHRTFTSADVFVAKLTDSGTNATFAWVLRGGGNGDDYAQALALSGPNLYLSGTYGSGPADFGTALSNANNNGTSDGYVARIVDNGGSGRFGWAARFGGYANDEGKALAVAGTDIYVAGSFTGPSSSFGSITLTNNPTNTSLGNVFVAKLSDSARDFVWAVGAGGPDSDRITGLALNGSSVYVAGYFAGANTTFGATTLLNQGNYDLFVAKLADAGPTATWAWANSAGSAEEDYASNLVASGPNLYVAGGYGGPTATFGPFTQPNPSGRHAMLAKLTDTGLAGAFTWVQPAFSPFDISGQSVAIQGQRIYLAGDFYPPASFGSLSITSPGGLRGSYLASLTDLTLATAPARSNLPFSIAPNPARSTATLRLPAPAQSPTTAVLLDALGRELRRYAVPARASSAVLDVNGLTPGVYLVRCGAAVGRLVVE